MCIREEGPVRRRNYLLCLLQTIAHTSDKVVPSLDGHTLWAELTVLSRFILALSFNNKVNGEPYRVNLRWLGV